MGMQKAWWKKLSVRSVTAGIGKAFQFLSGGLAAAQEPPQTPMMLGPAEQAAAQGRTLWLVAGVGVAIILVIALTRGK